MATVSHLMELVAYNQGRTLVIWSDPLLKMTIIPKNKTQRDNSLIRKTSKVHPPPKKKYRLILETL